MNMLAELLSSKVRSEFLRILFGVDTNEYHLREIQRRSGFAIGSVRQEAIKLVKLGLILKRPSANRTYFKANTAHPLYRDIRNLVLKTSGLADILTKSLTVKSVSFAFIFGSFAGGTENAESDVDLFIIGNISRKTVSNILKEPSNEIGREINTFIMSKEEFIDRKKQHEHFVGRVLESPKLMVIGSEYELTGLG